MFYSHQLLARKQPLGQIWMAATMHGKFSRKKLSKLNIIKICEEILNPQVPMALRLSGILMEGVVIIYEKKVKLLQDDASRLLVQINQAWKVVPTRDPTLLPKSKIQAKYKDITLPEIQGMEIDEMEQSTGNVKMMDDLPQTMPNGYFTVNLDDVDIAQFINKDYMEVDPSQYPHQAAPEDITLFEPVASVQIDNKLVDRFERFDIEGDDDTFMNFTSHDPSNIPSTLIPSPPRQVHPETSYEIPEQDPKDQDNQQAKEVNEPKKHQPRNRPIRRKTGNTRPILIDEQTIIPGPVYQSWLQDTSDIVSPRGGRKRKRSGVLHNMKIDKLMDLPPTVLSCALIEPGTQQIYYPKLLLELWNKSNRPPSPSGKIPSPQPPGPPQRSSSPNNGFYNDPSGTAFEDYNSGFGSGSFQLPMEGPRAMNTDDMSTAFPREIAKESTPGNSGEPDYSLHSSGSGPHSDPIPEDNARPIKKRAHSLTRLSVGSLEPVLEDLPWDNQKKSASKLATIGEIGLTLHHDFNSCDFGSADLYVETVPTQTQLPITTPPVDHFTDAIKNHLKTHFDTPGAPQTESLNELAFGMNKCKAAKLFYQTCVLVTRGFVRVQQRHAYGDILISRGPKM